MQPPDEAPHESVGHGRLRYPDHSLTDSLGQHCCASPDGGQPDMTPTVSESTKQLNATIGTLSLVCAAVVSGLIFTDRMTAISLPLPSFWYRTRDFHLLLNVALYVTGWIALRNASEVDSSSGHDTTAPVFQSIRMFTSQDCELCERAATLLESYGDLLPRISFVNISENSELMATYGTSIPVVEIDGVVRFRGIVNPILLDRLIDAKKRQRLRDFASSSVSKEAT